MLNKNFDNIVAHELFIEEVSNKSSMYVDFSLFDLYYKYITLISTRTLFSVKLNKLFDRVLNNEHKAEIIASAIVCHYATPYNLRKKISEMYKVRAYCEKSFYL